MITYHTQTHSLITINQVTEILAGSGNRDPLLIPQFMESTLNPKIRLPKLTIRYSKRPERQTDTRNIQDEREKKLTSTTSHRAEQVRINLDDLLHSTGSCYGVGEVEISRHLHAPI
jgi:hypothetical protein